ncbi:MAG: C40 family peptidase [Azoarcus sp.]|jgi:peptidoglycan endopeptidase LytF|nr:C40 family peptidase [Azoarcus sp.]
MKWFLAALALILTHAANAEQLIEQRIYKEAVAALKTPYEWGGTDLQKGVDCSGFIQSVFKRVGKEMPRTVSEQVRVGKRVHATQLHIGDLVFFKDKPDGHITHVGIYAGEGMMIHAPRKGTTVKVDKIYGKTYGPRFAQARRIVESKIE